MQWSCSVHTAPADVPEEGGGSQPRPSSQAIPALNHDLSITNNIHHKTFGGHHAGIVQGQGHVIKVHQRQAFRRMDIQFPAASMAGIQIGASVAINGTCLTVLTAPSPTIGL